MELQEIALQRCRIGFGILLLLIKRQELVLVWYFIAEIKNAKIGIENLSLYKSLQCPTLLQLQQKVCI